MTELNLKELGFIGKILAWSDQHPTITNIIIAIEIAAICWAVINYNFTTKI